MKFILNKYIPLELLDKVDVVTEEVEYYNYVRNKLDTSIRTTHKCIDIDFDKLNELSKYFEFTIYKKKDSQYLLIEIKYNSNFIND